MRMYAEKNLEALTSVVSTNEVREEVNANKDKKVVLNFQSAEAIHEDCKNERDKAITEFEKRFLPDWNNSFKQKEGYKKILFYIFCSLLFLVIISIIALGFVAAFNSLLCVSRVTSHLTFVNRFCIILVNTLLCELHYRLEAESWAF